ncbi:GntR family transcriptional regulator [Cryobacterium tepidiphilum]|uniref:GntR family transcriptional regulator n=1 Tax=Cryobacterium tepidiphilum TaxID=2486026 RepID=A0A3M8KV67_9MICO|nr:GntR family transcriptional regulator [Cryobacterium tepidiphilum]RNE57217.1 GntR family transcriptional regulator [Cryobacterium tepidiphilum]
MDDGDRATRAAPDALPVSKTQFVYEWIRQEILSGALEPGSRIRQQQVAETLGVSYTPVREAIRQLQATGLLTHSPNRGSAVSTLGDAALNELYLLRGAVEGLGARLAATSIGEADLAALDGIHAEMTGLVANEDSARLAELSRRFHSVIVAAGGPHIIYPKLQEIWSNHPVPRSASLWTSPEHAARALEAHERLIRALRAHDADAAAQAMEAHIGESVRFRLRKP